MRGHIAHPKRSAADPPKQRLVGVRELKAQAGVILRRVRDSQASYILTHRGRAIGVILPLDPRANDDQPADDSAVNAWANFIQAGQRLEGRFRRGVGGVRMLSAMRR
jgi:prevent-host-death family protein